MFATENKKDAIYLENVDSEQMKYLLKWLCKLSENAD